MQPEDAAGPRDRIRQQIVEVAARMLREGGPGALTTRSVADAAGVQAPTIYRIFGDKAGLLDAVLAQGFADYVGGKRIDPAADALDGLRAGWDTHIGFGLANPELFRLMHLLVAATSDTGATLEAGLDVLRERVHRVAEAGRLRVTEPRAVALISAAGTGVVLTLIDQSERERDDALAETAWEAVCAVILTDAAPEAPGPAAAAVALRAALPDLDELSPAERRLLGEWLDRIAG